MKKYRMVGFKSLPTHSNNDERRLIMVNMEVRILAMRNIDRLRIMSLEELAPLLISLRVIMENMTVIMIFL